MKPWRVCMAALVCLSAVGCQTAGDRNRELLEREMRWQEDEIFQLEDDLQDAQRKLDACRRENEGLRKQLAGSGGVPAAGGISLPSVDLGTPQGPAPTYENAPTVEEPALEAPPYDLPMRSSEPSGFDEDDDADEGLLSLASHQPDKDFVETDFHIAEIELNKLLTGTYDRDGHAGSDGVLVMVEPRNEEGRIINVPAQISIAVVDPSAYGEAGRVARWDFSADEAADRFRQTPLGRGMEFRLPWPGEPPTSNELLLHVRCITTDGIELRAKREVYQSLAGNPEPGWTLAAERADAVVSAQRKSRTGAAVAKFETVPIETARPMQETSPVREAAWDRATASAAVAQQPSAEVRPAVAAWPDEPTANQPEAVENGADPAETSDNTETKPAARKRAAWSPYR